MDEERLTKAQSESSSRRGWTSAEDYFEALARRRTARRARGQKSRTQPESPRLSLSTLPFLALIVGLLMLTIIIAVAAWPGSQPEPRPQQIASHEQGLATRGWFQDAEKEMRRQ